ncbi:hypothetical protein GCM10017600_20320 [Streptosporangium carneum]|uniref:Uncharacterized protein n=1 Tax=Streptosporangium carneum TaxID=47481 RepID=A0A9W6HYF0_9ACTN|nr:hypothetical protein GCM10017600_20320 [Streptosporangium carneum]
MLGAGVSLLLGVSCGGGESQPATTPLPLQSSGLVVGGDVQSRATDVVEIRLTEKQAQEIVDDCRGAIEIFEGQNPCADSLNSLIEKQGGDSREAPPSGERRCRSHGLCLKVYDVSDPDFAEAGFVEITDNRLHGKSLCESGPDHVCLRIGVKTSSVLDRIVGTVRPTASPTATVTPTPTEVATETSTRTSTETAPATPSVPSWSPKPEPTSAPPASP